jgi:RNA polymerase-binding transcription factor DksA
MSHLTQQQLKTLGRQLTDRYEILLSEVRAELAAAGKQNVDGLKPGTGDAGDESVADLIADLGATMVDRQLHEMREIERARERMADGSYGECADCGSDIPFERLLAYPTALRDVPCQNQYEKNYAHEGRPTL